LTSEYLGGALASSHFLAVFPRHSLNSSFSYFQEFMLCRKELDDPRKCIGEGRAVTSCALEFFRKVKKTCFKEFTQYANCLDKSSTKLEFEQ
jgi:hypothetical protein